MSDEQADATGEPIPREDPEEDEPGEDDSEMPPSRRKPRPFVIIGVIVLIVVIVGGGFFAARTFGGGLLTSAATPTPTVVPGANLFYITTNPAWGTVSIDGHHVSHQPALGQAPLQISPGSHTITWNAPPFPVQRCFVNILSQAEGGPGACNTNESTTVVAGKNAGQQAFVISFSATSANLSISQRASLTQAVKAYLTTFQASATVQPGEVYASAQAAHHLVTATQPLKATPHFQLDTNPNSTRPCLNYYSPGTPACNVEGISCQAFCPASRSDANGNALPATNWQVEVPVLITWSYTTLSGQVVAENEPNTPESSGYEDLVALSITWNSATSTWKVTNQPDSAPPSPFVFTTNPVCAAAQNWIKANPSHQSLDATTFNGQNTAVNRQYLAGTNAANGCLVKAVIPESSAPVGYLLYRFGVLLAVNAAAHHYWPSLPMADAYEQGIAQSIAAKIKP